MYCILFTYFCGKAFRSSTPRNGFLLNAFTLGSVFTIIIADQVVLPRLNMYTETKAIKASAH